MALGRCYGNASMVASHFLSMSVRFFEPVISQLTIDFRKQNGSSL